MKAFGKLSTTCCTGIYTGCNKQQKIFSWVKKLDRLEYIKQRVISCPVDSFYVAIYLNHILFIFGAKDSIITELFTE